MPEGPEVKIVRDFLRKVLKGKTVTQIYIQDGYKRKFKNNKLLIDMLPFTVDEIECKGKLIYMKIGELYLINHMMLTGCWHREEQNYTRVKFGDLYYDDKLKYGKFEVVNEDKLNEILDGMGMDIYEITEDYLRKTLSGRRGWIAGILINQKLIAGIGSYLRSEILYHAKIQPDTPAKDVDPNILCRTIHEQANKYYPKGSINYAKKMHHGDGIDFDIYRKEYTADGTPVKKTKYGPQYIYYV